ncbi:unnamed protein product [Pleuronectes platessa]|uniref:Uncharacterized protein n=1 Tax=Pleuronectes platessa TaxID=8262 RepID=A0A9N7U7Z6_PLEPL|nr:unnamed protein product [Pleuronectes platessa]
MPHCVEQGVWTGMKHLAGERDLLVVLGEPKKRRGHPSRHPPAPDIIITPPNPNSSIPTCHPPSSPRCSSPLPLLCHLYLSLSPPLCVPLYFLTLYVSLVNFLLCSICPFPTSPTPFQQTHLLNGCSPYMQADTHTARSCQRTSSDGRGSAEVQQHGERRAARDGRGEEGVREERPLSS